MHDIMHQMQNALKHYTFTPINVKVELFKAAVKMYYVDDPEYFGWKKLALGGVNTHIVPGDHREMFITPNDKYLAKALQAQLDKCPPTP
jgi:surfactin synthase thioesterase subunit